MTPTAVDPRPKSPGGLPAVNPCGATGDKRPPSFANGGCVRRRSRDALAPEQRTRVREEGFAGARHFSAEFIVSAICSVIQSGGKPANARLVAAAIRDTREVWASYFLPKDRARVIEYLASLDKQAPDETAQTDLAAFTAALQAVN